MLNGDYDTIRVEIADGIQIITLHRPEAMNAFTPTMMREMVAAFDRADEDDNVRAVIVTGNGERAFCAGAGLGDGAEAFNLERGNPWNGEPAPLTGDGDVDWTHPGIRDGGGILSMRIFKCRKPVIGAINGAAVGVGATMTLPMDFRFASEKARFGFVFARRGIVPEAASSWFLPRLVGIETALEWSYSGRLVGAEEALARGLIRSIHPVGDLLDAARRFATELVSQSAPVSIAYIRQMMWRMMGAASPMDAHRADSQAMWVRGNGGDVQEGVASFLEKRQPIFPERVSEHAASLERLLPTPRFR